MGIFGNKNDSKPLSIKKEMFCCQCHKKISECYVKPDKEDSYLDIFMMCPDCFVEIALYMNKKQKEENS